MDERIVTWGHICGHGRSKTVHAELQNGFKSE